MNKYIVMLRETATSNTRFVPTLANTGVEACAWLLRDLPCDARAEVFDPSVVMAAGFDGARGEVAEKLFSTCVEVHSSGYGRALDGDNDESFFFSENSLREADESDVSGGRVAPSGVDPQTGACAYPLQVDVPASFPKLLELADEIAKTGWVVGFRRDPIERAHFSAALFADDFVANSKIKNSCRIPRGSVASLTKELRAWLEKHKNKRKAKFTATKNGYLVEM